MDKSLSYLPNCKSKFSYFQRLLLNENTVLNVGHMGTCFQMWNHLTHLIDCLSSGCHYHLIVHQFLSSFVVLLRAVSVQANNPISIILVRCQYADNGFCLYLWPVNNIKIQMSELDSWSGEGEVGAEGKVAARSWIGLVLWWIVLFLQRLTKPCYLYRASLLIPV